MIVTVVIPIYKTDLSEFESKALDQVCTVLSGYPLVFVKPESLDLSPILQKYPQIQTESFDDKYFKDTIGYNQLMLLSDFYARFLASDYILIYQLDAYVFRDELPEWCKKGYDYVGAPWIQKPIYKFALARCWKRTKEKKKKLKEEETLNIEVHERIASRHVNPVGNGGLSLRKVKSHYDATLELKTVIDFYVEQKHSRSPIFNEDIFWASEPSGFKYPSVDEALEFSFDKYPKLCYKLNKKRLPFGCHAWYKKKAFAFWKKIIKI